MSKKIEPTAAMVDEAANAVSMEEMDTPLHLRSDLARQNLRNKARTALRAALNHPDAPGLFECDHTDYVHVDKAATRVDAAHEKGWDDAAQHIYNKGWEGVAALRKANPHRPAQPLPPERDGVVLVPADGHGAITTTKGQEFARLTFTTKQDLWYGPNLAARPGDWVIQTTTADRLTPGTWKVADQ